MAFFISFCNANLECSDDPSADRSLCNPAAEPRSRSLPARQHSHPEKLKALEWKMKKVLSFHPPSLWWLTQQSLSVWKRLIIFILLLRVINRKMVSRIKMLLAILISHKQTGTQLTFTIYHYICISSALEAEIGPDQGKREPTKTKCTGQELTFPPMKPQHNYNRGPLRLQRFPPLSTWQKVAACQLWMGQHPFNLSSHHHQIDCLTHNKVTWRQHILTENI